MFQIPKWTYFFNTSGSWDTAVFVNKEKLLTKGRAGGTKLKNGGAVLRLKHRYIFVGTNGRITGDIYKWQTYILNWKANIEKANKNLSLSNSVMISRPSRDDQMKIMYNR